MQTTLEKLTCEVIVNNTSIIESKIENYQLDVGIVEGYINNKNFIVKQIEEDELVLVAKASHPLSAKKEVDCTDLEKYPFITREDGSSNRNQFEIYLKEQKVNLQTNYSCSSVEAIKQALLYTDGISVLSKMMVTEEIKKGVLTVLPFKDMQFKRPIILIYHKNKYISKSMKVFFDILEQKI